MEMAEYQKLASRTINKNLDQFDKFIHAICGLASQAGQVAGLWQKTYQGHNLDDQKLKKELGDCLWFIAQVCEARGYQLEDVAQKNIQKLIERYPNGFQEIRSVKRKEYLEENADE